VPNSKSFQRAILEVPAIQSHRNNYYRKFSERRNGLYRNII